FFSPGSFRPPPRGIPPPPPRAVTPVLSLRSEASLRSLPADISLAPARLELRSAGACGALELPPGVSLAPGSCRGLRRLPGEGLHLRLRLRAAPGGAELVYNLRESLKPQKNCIFYCQSCGDVIVEERKFLRVLPLPSENWSALVEEWCCHPNPFAKSTLHPQRDDCFLGDTFFLLNSGNESHVPEPPICFSETSHHASQNESTLKSKENTRVFCKRCKTMLGETISSDTIKYYVTEVIVQPSEGSFKTIPRSQFVQSMVAQCLMELSSAKSTFRFTIKGDDGKIYILIWLLNSDTLLVESSGSSSSHNVFTLFGDIFMPNSGPVGTWNAVKVLYQPCIKSRNKDDPNRFYGVICTPGDSSTAITGVLLWILILLVFLGKAKLCSVSLKTALLGMTPGIYLTWMRLPPMLQLGLLSSY
uniref:E3 ubiquitin-protein ligase E3D n=1 Tax=Anser cygnoides TaxID=8845 RepID=A0A8B9DKK3_ANSCY